MKPLNYAILKHFTKVTEANGLLEETRYDMDNSGNLRVFYHANEDGTATINKYID